MTDAAARARQELGDLAVVNINSTAVGGGVDEMPRHLCECSGIPYRQLPVGPGEAIKRRVEDVHRSWGESLIGNVGLGVAGAVIAVPIFLLGFVGADLMRTHTGAGVMLDLMERELGFDRDRALVLASVVVDLRVTQIVNQVKGVHAVLADDALG